MARPQSQLVITTMSLIPPFAPPVHSGPEYPVAVPLAVRVAIDPNDVYVVAVLPLGGSPSPLTM